MTVDGQTGQPEPREGVLSISAYVPGDDGGGGAVHKLSSNETPLGPSPAAIDAFKAQGAALARYPDGSASVLRHAIADAYGLNPERIVCGHGSDELLSLLAQTYLGPGDEAIHTEHGFLVYRIAILAAGATPVSVAERNETADVDAILAAVNARTRMVFLANPNNPTGTYLPHREVRRLQETLPPRVLLVLDAAYAEYVRRNDYESGIELAGSAPNIVMTRTFSKVYGLASLRLGWAYGPSAVIDALHRVRGPFNVSGPAIAAGAAAVADRTHLAAAVGHNDRWLAELAARIQALGLRVTPSVGNFLLAHFPPDVPRKGAAKADAFLRRHGLIVRRVDAYGFPNALRISVGSDAANQALLDALQSFMAK